MTITRKNHQHPFLNAEQRKMAINEESKWSLLDLPPEVLERIPDCLNPSIVTDISPKLSETECKPLLNPKIQYKAALSRASFTLYNLFQMQINKEAAANELLKLVLQGNEAEVLKVAKENPSLFFLKTTAKDYAMDLEGNQRIIEDWSPYQAMFGTSDKYMLAAVKPHLDTYLESLPNGKAFAKEQEREKFPHGFDFPPSTYDFTKLGNVISSDQQLIRTGQPNETTLAALAEFRKFFTPGIVKTGHHFNMNDLIKADEVYDEIWRRYESKPNLKFFSAKVFGFLERLMTAPYLQAACQGHHKFLNTSKPNKSLNRGFKVMNFITEKWIAVAPLDEDLACRLGDNFVVDTYYGNTGWKYLNSGRFLNPTLAKYVVHIQLAIDQLRVDYPDHQLQQR